MNSETTKFYGIGRRKESVAQVLLTVGTGSVLINNKDAKEYLQNNESRVLRINHPQALYCRVQVAHHLHQCRYNNFQFHC